MRFSSSQCTNNFELILFSIFMLSGLIVIISMLLLFSNEADSKNEKSSWKYIPLIWLWPLRPFWTSNGLNSNGKKIRPVYIGSILILFSIGAYMKLNGYCVA